MAMAHRVVRRLEDGGEVPIGKGPDGEPFYDRGGEGALFFSASEAAEFARKADAALPLEEGMKEGTVVMNLDLGGG